VNDQIHYWEDLNHLAETAADLSGSSIKAIYERAFNPLQVPGQELAVSAFSVDHVKVGVVHCKALQRMKHICKQLLPQVLVRHCKWYALTRCLVKPCSITTLQSTINNAGAYLDKRDASRCRNVKSMPPLSSCAVSRVGQNLIYTPCMTVYSVISLPKLPYIHHTV